MFVSSLAVVIGVVILAAITLGYSFNSEEGRLERGGILQINSKPSGAKLTINGQRHPSNTPAKIVSEAGDYALEIEKEGYRTWQKTAPIQAGNITWVMYPRLIPQKISPVRVADLPDTLADGLPSGSSKRYAFLKSADSPATLIANLDSEEVQLKEFTLPPDIYEKPTKDHPKSTFSLKLWSADERLVLLRHVYADNKEEWLLLNRDKPKDSFNITKMFGVAMTDVVFANNSGSQLYAIVDGAVRLIDISSQTISRPLVENAQSYSLSGDYIVFVSKPTKQNKQQLGYMHKEFKEPYIIDTVPYDGSHSAQFDMGKYYDTYYYLVTNGRTATLTRSNALPHTYSTEASFKRLAVKTYQLDRPIRVAHITDNGQFATIQDGWSFATYNLEVGQLATTDFQTDTQQKPQKLRYLDRYLLWAERDGYLRTYEFDGANQHSIMPIEARFDATLSPSGKYLYGVRNANDTYQLIRVQLLGIKP